MTKRHWADALINNLPPQLAQQVLGMDGFVVV
jgi:hypothetical protein